MELWDISSRQLVDVLSDPWHMGSVISVAFSPDGSLLASVSRDFMVRPWDVFSHQLVNRLTGHWGGVSSVAFSPDGSLLASGSDDKTVKLWDVSTGQLVDTLTGHSREVWSVAFSPDGGLLASGSRDGTILLWAMELSSELQMDPGWNLISLPLQPLDMHPAAVLASIDTKYNSVWAYDPYAGWSVYMPGFPSNLLSMEPGRGYWVEMDQGQSETLTFEGTAPVSTDVPLWEGKWNLVGYSSLITRTAEACMSGVADFINSVWGYNPTTGWSVYAPGGPGDLIFMKPGCGYWIKADETCIWDVNAPAQ